eukprot:13309988-Ditylum_brightwellii.AAC.1
MVKKAKTELFVSIKSIVYMYGKREFYPEAMLMDREFAHIVAALASLGVELNITSANEHLPEIERTIL